MGRGKHQRNMAAASAHQEIGAGEERNVTLMNMSILEKLARQAMSGANIAPLSSTLLKDGRITDQEYQALTSLRRVATGSALAITARQSGAIDGVVASKGWTDRWWV